LSAVAPAAESIPAAGGDECVQPPRQKPCDCDTCQSGDGEDTRQNGGSWVNTVLREYNRNDLDLTVKVPGGVLEVRRLFTDGQWYIGPGHTPMSSPASGATYLYKIGDVLLVVLRNGVAYRRGPGEVIVTARVPYDGAPYCDSKYLGSDKFFYNYEEFNLDFQQDKNGDWRLFDEKDRVRSMGNRSTTLSTIIYDSGYHYPVGVEDGNGRQVIWYEYNDDNLISAVRDLAGRRVEYEYQGKKLVTVRDPLGNETMFHYAVINEKSRAGRYADFVRKYFVANESTRIVGDTGIHCNGRGGWKSTSDYKDPLIEP
ncbi:MAG: hypothetical protein GY859_35225, partial [Desulfobacterales bacterium]|nr:hypothetical protein [Desulfobacterales bacterium]